MSPDKKRIPKHRKYVKKRTANWQVCLTRELPNRLQFWPPNLRVLPVHITNSACARSPGSSIILTIDSCSEFHTDYLGLDYGSIHTALATHFD